MRYSIIIHGHCEMSVVSFPALTVRIAPCQLVLVDLFSCIVQCTSSASPLARQVIDINATKRVKLNQKQ